MEWVEVLPFLTALPMQDVDFKTLKNATYGMQENAKRYIVFEWIIFHGAEIIT